MLAIKSSRTSIHLSVAAWVILFLVCPSLILHPECSSELTMETSGLSNWLCISRTVLLCRQDGRPRPARSWQRLHPQSIYNRDKQSHQAVQFYQGTAIHCQQVCSAAKSRLFPSRLSDCLLVTAPCPWPSTGPIPRICPFPARSGLLMITPSSAPSTTVPTFSARQTRRHWETHVRFLSP